MKGDALPKRGGRSECGVIRHAVMPDTMAARTPLRPQSLKSKWRAGLHTCVRLLEKGLEEGVGIGEGAGCSCLGVETVPEVCAQTGLTGALDRKKAVCGTNCEKPVSVPLLDTGQHGNVHVLHIYRLQIVL